MKYARFVSGGVVATDPLGNVWHGTDAGKGVSSWRLYKEAKDVVQPTLTLDQLLQRQ